MRKREGGKEKKVWGGREKNNYIHHAQHRITGTDDISWRKVSVYDVPSFDGQIPTAYDNVFAFRETLKDAVMEHPNRV